MSDRTLDFMDGLVGSLVAFGGGLTSGGGLGAIIRLLVAGRRPVREK